MSSITPNTALQRTRLRAPLSFRTFGVMKEHSARMALAVAVVVFHVIGIADGGPLKSQARYRIFFPRVDLNSTKGERVDRIELSMTCGSFRAVSVIPEDWSLEVVSPSSARTRLSANAGHGSSALGSLDKLQGAVTISVDEAECFDLSAKITVAMQDSSRVVELPRSQLVLRP